MLSGKNQVPIKTPGNLCKVPLTGFSPVCFELLPSHLKASFFFFYFLLTWVYCADGFCFNKAHDEVTASSLRELHEYF